MFWSGLVCLSGLLCISSWLAHSAFSPQLIPDPVMRMSTTEPLCGGLGHQAAGIFPAAPAVFAREVGIRSLEPKGIITENREEYGCFLRSKMAKKLFKRLS